MQISLGKKLSFETKAIATILAILLLPTIFLFVIPVSGNSGVTGMNLFLTEIDGDEVVYDGKNGILWYPHLQDMLQMTKAEQQGFIDQLNADEYGKRTDWHFATLEQMIALGMSVCEGATQIMGNGPPAGSPVQFTPVHLENYFEYTQYFPSAGPFPEHYLTMGRTADEWALRQDPDGTVDVRYGEGQYHFPQLADPTGELNILMFDDDVNYVADDATTSPMMGMDQECSAWVVSEAEPEVFEGNVKITTPDLSYEGPAEFHVLEHVVFLHFCEEWFKWDITRHTGWGWVESYLCHGDLGKLSVTIFHSIGRINLIAAGYQQPISKVLFSGST